MKFKEPVVRVAIYEKGWRGKRKGERWGVKNRRKAERASRTRESAVNKTGIIRQSRSDFICASTLLRFYSAAFYPL